MWNVEYVDLKKFEKWFRQLSKEGKFEVLYELIQVLSEKGNELRMPDSRALSGGLFELREPTYGLRIYYIFREKKIILLLHGGDKGTQKEDIHRARDIQKKFK